MTTPIRETIARAILYDLDEHSAAYVGFDADKMDEARVDGDCDFLSAADAVLRALDEAGCVVVRKEASDAMVEAILFGEDDRAREAAEYVRDTANMTDEAAARYQGTASGPDWPGHDPEKDYGI